MNELYLDFSVKRLMKWFITSSYVFDAMNFSGENVNLDVESAYDFLDINE